MCWEYVFAVITSQSLSLHRQCSVGQLATVLVLGQLAASPPPLFTTSPALYYVVIISRSLSSPPHSPTTPSVLLISNHARSLP